LSSCNLAFIAATLRGDRTYNLGALIAFRLDANRKKGGICGGLIASRLLALHAGTGHALEGGLAGRELHRSTTAVGAVNGLGWVGKNKWGFIKKIFGFLIGLTSRAHLHLNAWHFVFATSSWHVGPTCQKLCQFVFRPSFAWITKNTPEVVDLRSKNVKWYHFVNLASKVVVLCYSLLLAARWGSGRARSDSGGQRCWWRPGADASVADVLSSLLGVICVGRRVACQRSGEERNSMALVRAIIMALIRVIIATWIRERLILTRALAGFKTVLSRAQH
jgi:hypothetical protein